MIWLLRHGEAAEGRPDDQRPLTELGERQARAAGAALAKLGVRVEVCLSSPKKRALDTARLACESLGMEVTVDERLKGGPFDPEELVGDAEALLVGHDPDFSAAVHAATGAQVRMKKGALAGIERGELKVLLRPNETFTLAE
ncbi:MAG TPA: phosphoglycerate mutase family protein [Thermoleophilaceae bacterium]|jgi:phosphohistidine phosphatase|nr:phosphoglycerate mutase family protein [Thermoleophilaceae bacterium]